MLNEVIQVLPNKNFTVYVYFANGKIKLYDCKPLLNKGIFKKISKIDDFIKKCTVMNHTLAWDLSGKFDPYNCIDLDPSSIYEEGIDIKDPLL